jgi:hypothetical protein
LDSLAITEHLRDVLVESRLLQVLRQAVPSRGSAIVEAPDDERELSLPAMIGTGADSELQDANTSSAARINPIEADRSVMPSHSMR